MNFGSGDVCHGGGYWSVVFNHVTSHYDCYSVSIFIMWYVVSDDLTVCDLYILS